MKYVLGAIVGIIWGSLCELLNGFVTTKALKKTSIALILLTNMWRLFMDVVALGAVFLLREVMPFDFVATIVGTAAGLSITMIIYGYWTAAKK